MKGNLRQFNVARTPQQNGVAERSNRTLIEASTMLADSKLPTTFISRSTQSNGFAGTKISDNAGQARKETEPVKDYILLPLWTADLPYSQDPKNQEKEDNVNSTNNVNAASTNEVDVVGEKTSIELPFDPNMPALKDYGIFDFSRDDEDDGAEADINNLDTTIQVSPIPTTRIHKDHLLDQVIGDLQSAIQTRKMSNNLKEHGFDPSWIEAIQEELLQLKLQEVWTLLDLPNRKMAIGTKWVFRNKKDERGIVIRNKARLVAQGYTQEEGIDYDEIVYYVRAKLDRKFYNRRLSNPRFLATVKAKTINGEVQLHVLVDGKKIIITESTVRRDLQLEDAEGVDYEAIHKEFGDSLVRAATTASNLEAEQDSGGGPRCQETMGDTIAQTRFEKVSKHSNDLLLARGNTLRSDEDRLKVNELMELCTNLQKKVFDLEKIKTTQANEIATRVESSGDEENLVSAAGLQVSVTPTTTAATTIEEITLAQALQKMKSSTPKAKGVHEKPLKKKDQIRLDDETVIRLQAEFDKEEMLAKEEAEKIEKDNIALINTWDDIQAKIDTDYESWLKDCKHKSKKSSKRAEEKRNEPPTLAQQRKIICTTLKNMEGKKFKDLKNKSFNSIQKMFNRAFKRVDIFVDFRTNLVEGSSKRAGEELEQENEEEVIIDDIPLAVKSPRIVEWKIHKEGKKSYYQIIRADGKSQMYMIISQMIKSFNKEDLEDLYKLVKARYGSTRPVEDLDLVLWNDLKTITFLEFAIWNDLHAGRKEISPYTTYNYRYAEQEAPG
ncbi:ribonuclease H-like domain-containing protein [Tanacetum coccineum]